MRKFIEYYCKAEMRIRNMEKYRRNYQGVRTGCSCTPEAAMRSGGSRQKSCAQSDLIEDTKIYMHIDKLPIGMAYVPRQNFRSTFETGKALSVGTIFPELCKPFCGRRGVRR